MRLIPTEELKTNSKLSFDIFTGNENIIFKNGDLVNSEMIKTLKQLNISQIYISDEYSFSNDTYFPTSDQSIINNFIHSFQKFILKIKQHHFVENDFNELYILAEKAVRLHLIFKSKLKLRYLPENMFGNSYVGKNVYIPTLCAILGFYRGYSLEQMTKLFVAAFLRDISLDFPIFKKEANKLHLHPIATC
ncbi:MAG: hypothetical protein ATN32_05840 [Candidatus Epulonipiscium fishelsonii]|nr:MAG: hypothetical protein ATN32_05840 [Epulopiscium sp. AS2M-Bin002]